jgi:hypothetical protein
MCGDTNACTVESCNTASGQCQTTATVQCPDPMCQLCDPSVGCKAREPLPLGCNAPPVCSQALAEPGELWPPRRRFFSDVSVAGVTDPDGDPVSITITGITQDEPLQGLRGAGRRCPDADGAGTATASLRTERIGRRDGRVYHISFTAADGRGGTCAGLVTVCVPHDQRLGHVCIDQGPLVDSTGPCS